MKITAVIPCYNEEKSIGSVIQSMPKEVNEILVVDNNSTDKSAEVAQKLGARVVKELRKGYGYAYQKGFESVDGDIIVTLDADGQYSPEEIPNLLKYFSDNNLDFLSASRIPFSKGSEPFIRGLGNIAFTKFTNLLFGLKLQDSWSGMWVFKKDVLQYLPLKSGDMPLSQEIKIRAALSPHIKFGEYHIPYFPRTGDSKLFPLKHGLMTIWFLLGLKKELFYEKRK